MVDMHVARRNCQLREGTRDNGFVVMYRDFFYCDGGWSRNVKFALVYEDRTRPAKVARRVRGFVARIVGGKAVV